MADDRIPKDVFYGELDAGRRTRGGQGKRYKVVIKATLKSCGIPHNTWEATATIRVLWGSRPYLPFWSTRLLREEVRRPDG